MLLLEEARAYCDVIDHADALGTDTFVERACDALLAVVAAAFSIPEQNFSFDESNSHEISHDDWVPIYRRIADVLGPANDYWTGEPSPENPLLGTLSNLPLADDLADIWRDLEAGLLALEAGAIESDVLWEWKFTFEAHWGRHASEALRVLAQLRLAKRGLRA
jgi:hypothetical protein